MKPVFIDTSGIFAYLVAEDANHAEAARLLRELRDRRRRLITTNTVVVETYAVLLSRVRNGRELAIQFLDLVERGFCALERVGKRDEARAFALVRGHADKTYSLCDALSFVVMERLGVTEAVAFDQDFRRYGRFTVLGAPG